MSVASDLQSLRWAEDTVITNYEGERVWLKAVIRHGKRIGVTDCCLESEPCDYHSSLLNATVIEEPQ